jgi:hypothetical protein
MNWAWWLISAIVVIVGGIIALTPLDSDAVTAIQKNPDTGCLDICNWNSVLFIAIIGAIAIGSFMTYIDIKTTKKVKKCQS